MLCFSSNNEKIDVRQKYKFYWIFILKEDQGQ